MDGSNSKTGLFETEGLVRIYRRIPGLLSNYIEYEGIVEDIRDEMMSNGNRQFTVSGPNPNGLLSRRHVLWPVGTSQASKSAACETAMKEYVKENLGSLALESGGRHMDGNDTRVTVAGSGGAGPTWSGDKANANLFDVIKEIADYSRDHLNPIDFEVVATDILEWQFQTFEDQIGEDRSYSDMNASTGLNGAGNAPVILSREMGNVSSIVYSMKHSVEKNAAAVLGSGYGEVREVVTDTDPGAIDISGQRETVRSANSNITAELETLAAAELKSNQAAENLDINLLQQENTLYGLHYNVGDILTSFWRKADGTETRYHKRVMGVTITVTSKGETIQHTFADI